MGNMITKCHHAALICKRLRNQGPADDKSPTTTLPTLIGLFASLLKNSCLTNAPRIHNVYYNKEFLLNVNVITDVCNAPCRHPVARTSNVRARWLAADAMPK